MKTKSLLFILAALFTGSLLAQQPVGWKENSPSNFVPMTIAMDTNKKIEGNTSVKITFTETGTPYYESLAFPITPSTPFNFYIHLFDNDPGGEVQFQVRFLTSAGASISTNVASTYPADSTEWRKLSLSGTSPATAAFAFLRVRIFDVAASWTGSATFNLDNCLYTEGSSSNNLMPNYSFENWIFALTQAYCSGPSTINLMFNGNLTSVNPSDYKLMGVDTITFSTATISSTNPKMAILTGPSSSFLIDNKLDSIVTTSSGKFKFYAGILPVSYTNILNQGGVVNETDIATYKGIVSAKSAARTWISDATGPYNSINTYSSTGVISNDVAIGDEIIFAGVKSPYDSQTELVDPMLISKVSSGNSLFINTLQGSEIPVSNGIDSLPAEKWEGAFVQMNNVNVLSFNTAYFICSNDNGATQFRVGNRFTTYGGTFGAGTLTIGNKYTLKGVIVGRTGEYHLSLRDSLTDILNITAINEVEKNKGFVLFPNPANEKITINNNYPINQIKLFDISGRLEDVLEINGELSKEINIENLKKGFYFIQITDKINHISNHKFLKQ